MRTRDGLYYAKTGEVIDGCKAAEMGLVNEAVPKEKLRERVRELADVLLEKSPDVPKAAKDAFKRVQQLDWDMSEDYLISKQEQLWFVAGEERDEGMKQFLDDKTYKKKDPARNRTSTFRRNQRRNHTLIPRGKY